VVPLRLIDERFYHLDTCFCPLPGGRLVYFPAAFDQPSLAMIRSRVPPARRFEIGLPDAMGFACNAVVVGTTFSTNSASAELGRQLSAWGFDVVRCPLEEFILAGGAAKCLALRLTHEAPNQIMHAARVTPAVCDQLIEAQGHLLDAGLMSTLFDSITGVGGSFEVEKFQPGFRHDQQSWAQVRVVAQREYARLVTGADMILMLSSMLHSIGVGNMTPAGVRLICVDISPAVVTKLADRGSIESTGIVTDVGLFLNLLEAALAEEAMANADRSEAGDFAAPVPPVLH
jgi:hypothetical protein